MIKTSVTGCIQADPDLVAKVVLFPGDPLRAKFIAENFLTDAVLFNDVRNMLGYTGMYKGKRISVMGSGMGIPSATLYATDLYNEFGVESIIRVGSTGALTDDVNLRDIIIAMSASTNSDFASQYDFPAHLAPTADWDLLKTAVAAGEQMNIPVKVGSVISTDTFINAIPNVNEKWRQMGMLGVEMETAGIYALSMAMHKKAVSILSVSDHIFKGEFLTPEEIRDGFTDMMKISLETAWKFA
jgi:purine-nucleoside phosphorylase